jgi:hypothetical protein
MPARSTPFQNLVAHIQTRLSAGASVEESALLRHRMTGEAREVDVVIRSSIGEHPVVVSVECIDQSRQADTTWIEQMKTKHDHLETDRLVLVSRSVWVVARACEVPPLKVPGGQLRRLDGADPMDLTKPGMRAMMFGMEPDGSRVFYDVVIASAVTVAS